MSEGDIFYMSIMVVSTRELSFTSAAWLSYAVTNLEAELQTSVLISGLYSCGMLGVLAVVH
jgi:hypothetical protein